MSAFKSLVSPNLGFRTKAGMCLAMAQGIVGAPVANRSATDAANLTKYRHATRIMPNSIAILWFDHWGAYDDGLGPYHSNPVGAVGNWGHVVVWIPGVGFASSTPWLGEYSTPYIYGSIEAVERTFNSSYRFWSEDINGLRVCEPVKQSKWEDTLKHFLAKYSRSKPQVVAPNTPTRARFNNNNDTTFAMGNGDIVSATATVQMKGTPGGRVEVTMVRETVNAKLIETKTERITRARAIFDSAGLAAISLTGSTPIRGHRMRTIIHPSVSAGRVTITSYDVGGYVRPGK